MTEQEQVSGKFILGSASALRALPRWLQGRKYNAYKSDLTDRLGNPMIGLSFFDGSDKPFVRAGVILVKDQSCMAAAIEIVDANIMAAE